jgi:hypothetical protein
MRISAAGSRSAGAESREWGPILFGSGPCTRLPVVAAQAQVFPAADRLACAPLLVSVVAPERMAERCYSRLLARSSNGNEKGVPWCGSSSPAAR